MNNSTFDKTIENLTKILNVWLVNNAIDHKKYVIKSSFVSQKIFSKHFVAIHEIKLVSTLDKPIYVGFSIPHSSKNLMYEFYHKTKCKYNGKFLFTDTYSLWI